MLSYAAASEAASASLAAKRRRTTTSKGENTVNILMMVGQALAMGHLMGAYKRKQARTGGV
jgi:hypothetical protein